jgi:hypothetical protein
MTNKSVQALCTQILPSHVFQSCFKDVVGGEVPTRVQLHLQTIDTEALVSFPKATLRLRRMRASLQGDEYVLASMDHFLSLVCALGRPLFLHQARAR